MIEGGSTWEPEREQETSFGGTGQRTEVHKEHVRALYHVLSENLEQTPEAFHLDDFEIRYGKLYYRDKSTSLSFLQRQEHILEFSTETRAHP